MSSRAYWESDSMSPAPNKLADLENNLIDLQLSLNAKMMARITELEKQVKELKLMQSV
jgi:hypothetical protein